MFISFSSPLYERMFHGEGWEIVRTIDEADLIQFTGGVDVSPYLYGQKKHPKTTHSLLRDKKDAVVFALGLGKQIPMVGICRGGQFLNVMCGGELWQDVCGHSNGTTHEVLDVITNKSFRATSTHHQMMIVAEGGIIIGVADESKFRSSVLKNGNVIQYHVRKLNDFDTEIVFYPKHKVLCFQPHPEFVGVPDLKMHYFVYIYKYLFPSGYVEKGIICAD